MSVQEQEQEQVCTYLQTAEVYHAVHHLCDTEAVAEVVKGVVPVVVMDTELSGEKDTGVLPVT